MVCLGIRCWPWTLPALLLLLLLCCLQGCPLLLQPPFILWLLLQLLLLLLLQLLLGIACIARRSQLAQLCELSRAAGFTPAGQSICG
jgi:hypothetical protein